MTEHSRQALVADIGGTYISLAIADIDELAVSHFALLSSADFKSPLDAIERYLHSLPSVPDKASLAIAGTVETDGVHVTHRPWTITKRDVRAVTGAEWVTLLNDLEALALSLPCLTDYELIEIGKRAPVRYGNKVVIGAGTALGVAGLVWSGEKWITVCGEGGQVAFPAPKPGEFDIRSAFASEAFLPAEEVFSGKGLVAVYGALLRSRGEEPKPLSPPQITKLGLAGDDAAATEAVNLIASAFGRFAGDIALVFGARGGVYLAGGLSAGIVPAIDHGRFRAAFADKGAMNGYLDILPLKVIKTGADAGLRGAAIALARELSAGTGQGRRTLSRAC